MCAKSVRYAPRGPSHLASATALGKPRGVRPALLTLRGGIDFEGGSRQASVSALVIRSDNHRRACESYLPSVRRVGCSPLHPPLGHGSWRQGPAGTAPAASPFPGASRLSLCRTPGGPCLGRLLLTDVDKGVVWGRPWALLASGVAAPVGGG